MSKYFINLLFKNATVDIMERFGSYLKLIEIGQHTPVFVETNYSTQGVDGVVNQGNTFAPFVVPIRFKIRVRDDKQYHLVANDIRQFLSRRGNVYLQHYQLPFIKYPISKIETQFTRQSSTTAELTINFTCFTGCGISVITTAELQDKKEFWAMGGGLRTKEERTYTYTDQKTFPIYNDSADTIDVRKRHALTITISDVEYGPDDDRENKAIQIENMTTGDKFRYEKELRKKDKLELSGVFPLLNGEHVGKDTNHDVIRIASGKNNIKIYGAEKFKITFDFNFLYR